MTLDETNPIIISLNAFTPDGWAVKVSINADSVLHDDGEPIAVKLDSWLRAHEFQQSLPGLEPGEEKSNPIEFVTRYVKTNSDNTVTSQISFWPGGDQLQNRDGYMYLNTPEDVELFEAISGLSLESIPDTGTNSSMKKSEALWKKNAVKVKNTFYIVRKWTGEYHDKEQKNRRYDYRYFAPVQAGTPTQTTENAETGTQGETWPTLPLIGQLVRTFNDNNNTHIEPAHFAQMAGIENRSNVSEWGKKYKTGKEAYAAVLAAYQDGALTRIQETELSGMDGIEAAAQAESAAPK